MRSPGTLLQPLSAAALSRLSTEGKLRALFGACCQQGRSAVQIEKSVAGVSLSARQWQRFCLDCPGLAQCAEDASEGARGVSPAAREVKYVEPLERSELDVLFTAALLRGERRVGFAQWVGLLSKVARRLYARSDGHAMTPTKSSRTAFTLLLGRHVLRHPFLSNIATLAMKGRRGNSGAAAASLAQKEDSASVRSAAAKSAARKRTADAPPLPPGAPPSGRRTPRKFRGAASKTKPMPKPRPRRALELSTPHATAPSQQQEEDAQDAQDAQQRMSSKTVDRAVSPDALAAYEAESLDLSAALVEEGEGNDAERAAEYGSSRQTHSALRGSAGIGYIGGNGSTTASSGSSATTPQSGSSGSGRASPSLSDSSSPHDVLAEMKRVAEDWKAVESNARTAVANIYASGEQQHEEEAGAGADADANVNASADAGAIGSSRRRWGGGRPAQAVEEVLDSEIELALAEQLQQEQREQQERDEAEDATVAEELAAAMATPPLSSPTSPPPPATAALLEDSPQRRAGETVVPTQQAQQATSVLDESIPRSPGEVLQSVNARIEASTQVVRESRAMPAFELGYSSSSEEEVDTTDVYSEEDGMAALYSSFSSMPGAHIDNTHDFVVSSDEEDDEEDAGAKAGAKAGAGAGGGKDDATSGASRRNLSQRRSPCCDDDSDGKDGDLDLDALSAARLVSAARGEPIRTPLQRRSSPSAGGARAPFASPKSTEKQKAEVSVLLNALQSGEITRQELFAQLGALEFDGTGDDLPAAEKEELSPSKQVQSLTIASLGVVEEVVATGFDPRTHRLAELPVEVATGTLPAAAPVAVASALPVVASLGVVEEMVVTGFDPRTHRLAELPAAVAAGALPPAPPLLAMALPCASVSPAHDAVVAGAVGVEVKAAAPKASPTVSLDSNALAHFLSHDEDHEAEAWLAEQEARQANERLQQQQGPQPLRQPLEEIVREQAAQLADARAEIAVMRLKLDALKTKFDNLEYR